MTAETGPVPSAAELARLLEADGVLLLASDGQELTVADIWPPHPSTAALSMPVGFGVTGLVARNGTPVVLASDSPRNALHDQRLGDLSSTE